MIQWNQWGINAKCVSEDVLNFGLFGLSGFVCFSALDGRVLLIN